jgi:hypothetical protein
VLFVLFLCCSLAVNGRVFRAIGVRDGRLNTAGLPWEFAYHTTMNVNGRRNAVQVYSARFNESVLDQLRNRFEAQGATVTLQQSPDSAVGVAKGGGHEARFLVLSADSQPNQMIFLFYPEAGKAAEQPRSPVPDYPRGVTSNTVLNEDTNATCSTLQTEDSAEQVHAYYAGVLGGSGWKVLIPPRVTGVSSGGMAIYQKRNQVCCVLAKNRPGSLNQVTVLVKGGGL